MIISPFSQSSPRLLRTLHKWEPMTLENNMRTAIVWRNPANHSDPFPWNINDSVPNALAQDGGPFVDPPMRVVSLAAGPYPGDVFPRCDLELWAVDAGGADLSTFALSGPDSPGINVPAELGLINPPIDDGKIYGLYWKLSVEDCTCTIELSPSLFWFFTDDTFSHQVPIPFSIPF